MVVLIVCSMNIGVVDDRKKSQEAPFFVIPVFAIPADVVPAASLPWSAAGPGFKTGRLHGGSGEIPTHTIRNEPLLLYCTRTGIFANIP